MLGAGTDAVDTEKRRRVMLTTIGPELSRRPEQRSVVAEIQTAIVQHVSRVLGELEPFCGGFLYTHVDTEGLMQGIPMEAVRAVREAIGPEIRLAVDANHCFTVPQAIRLGRAMEEHA